MAERVHTFLLVKEPGSPDRILVWDTQDISVGRAPENDLTIEMEEVSRRHAQFERVGNDYVIKDLGTSNGTTVNGAAMRSHKLANEDRVGIGELEMVFYRLARNPSKLKHKVEYASQLKAFAMGHGQGASPEATMLGLGDPIGGANGEGGDEFKIERDEFDLRGGEPRNLDLEIEPPSLEGIDEEIVAPKADSAFLDLDDVADLVDGEGAGSAGAISIEIEGLPDDLRRRLAPLMGRTIQLPALKIRLK